jgi:hypothetical protein
LIELVLPVALSSAVLLVLAGYTQHWDLHSPVGLGVFGLLLVVISLVISIRVDAFTLGRRKQRGRKQLLNRADSRSRLVKFILGGVVIPLATLAAANRIELPGHQTPMSIAIRFRLARPAMARAEKLGNAVLRAQSPAAKVQGILALQAMRSGDGLDQLLHVLESDPAALEGGGESQALSQALASYGADARVRLLHRFDQVSPNERGSATAPPGGLYERYFSADFDGLKREIERRIPAASAGELDRLQSTRAALQDISSRFEIETRSAPGNAGLPAFILQTLLQMDRSQDRDLIAFARATAADGAWSEAVRGQALLLVGKAGENEDLDTLYGYLDGPSPLLQARAMQAIAALESKVSAAVRKD